MAIHFNFEAIGTTWKIDILDNFATESEEKLLETIKKRIDIFDQTYSRFRADSTVILMSEKVGEYVLPNDALPMMNLYRELYDLTQGQMTLLIGQVLSDAGYDAQYSLQAKDHIPKARRWNDVMGYKHPVLAIKEPALLDFGAMGKGYLVDIVAEILRGQGILNYTVDAGGDIAHVVSNDKKSATISVGLEDPDNVKQIVGIARISNVSICGSAGNRRAWGKYHHIINPETIESPRHIRALWTTADSTILADAMATALFFVEPEVLVGKYKFEYAILYSDRSSRTSPGFPGSFYQ